MTSPEGPGAASSATCMQAAQLSLQCTQLHDNRERRGASAQTSIDSPDLEPKRQDQADRNRISSGRDERVAPSKRSSEKLDEEE